MHVSAGNHMSGSRVHNTSHIFVDVSSRHILAKQQCGYGQRLYQSPNHQLIEVHHCGLVVQLSCNNR